MEKAGILGGKSADHKFIRKDGHYIIIGSVVMSGLKDGAVVREFRELDIEVKLGSSVLDRRKLRDFLAGHYLEEIYNWHSLSLSLFLFLSLPISVQEIGRQYDLDANKLCNEWVAYSAQNDDCELVEENIEKWESTLHVKSRQTPTTSRTAVSKTRRRGGDGATMYTQDDLGDM